MRPVILGLSGSEAMTLRAQVDVKIDTYTACVDGLDPDTKEATFAVISLLRSIRDKLDAGLELRDTDVKAPF